MFYATLFYGGGLIFPNPGGGGMLNIGGGGMFLEGGGILVNGDPFLSSIDIFMLSYCFALIN
jgi:hypothetical protein